MFGLSTILSVNISRDSGMKSSMIGMGMLTEDSPGPKVNSCVTIDV